MSIIDHGNPLNLSYKIIIVTNASTPLGVVVCNTLLKANALVLGTDIGQKEHSLSASKYSHFQFWQCDLNDQNAAQEVIGYAKQIFRTDRIDGLVNLARVDNNTDPYRDLATGCAKEIAEGLDGGAIVNTFLEVAEGDARTEKAASTLLKAMEGNASAKVRCNAVGFCVYLSPSLKSLVRLTCLVDGEKVEQCQQYDSARGHLDFLYKRLP